MANWLQQAIKLLTRSETIRAGLFFLGEGSLQACYQWAWRHKSVGRRQVLPILLTLMMDLATRAGFFCRKVTGTQTGGGKVVFPEAKNKIHFVSG